MSSDIKDSRITFRNLFDRFDRIEIPLIQRDYAQGRSSAEDVRTGLLDSLYSALEKDHDDASLPLDLDFIYGTLRMELGSQSTGGATTFCPLDGQQRLTTLFLLHWYCAWRADRGDNFKKQFCRDGKSRFSYLVRPSSAEFFDALSNWFPVESECNGHTLSRFVQDQPWFFLSWTQDPTIQSALEMLDAVQKTFGGASGLYDKLGESGKPHITFQLLELEQFGLSDDLYIKMNARGKPLTVFENFKAKLEQHLSASFPKWREVNGQGMVSVKEYFSHRIETSWADLFWKYRDKSSHLFDEQIMNLFRTVAIITRDPDADNFDDTWLALRDERTPLSFQRCSKLGCTDELLFRTFFSLLDRLSEGENGIATYLDEAFYFDENGAFEKAIKRNTNLTPDELVLFHAYAGYLMRFGNIDVERLSEWMRLVSNLARNTVYNRPDDYRRSIRALNEIFESAEHILVHISEGSERIPGFNEQQAREEKLKAQLILKNDDWKKVIINAEHHGYFAGQIEFLLKFSGVLDRWLGSESCDWDEIEDGTLRAKFTEYQMKAESIFSERGVVNFGASLWERALLSLGNYLTETGRNLSFLKNDGREASWKRLLRGNPKKATEEENRLLVKQLLDKIDLGTGVAECLRAVIDEAAVPEAWRAAIIEAPAIIEFCTGRMIRWEWERPIYLLRRSQMNGEHAELFSYYLYLCTLPSMVEAGKFGPFDPPEYRTVMDRSEEPYVELIAKVRETTFSLKISSPPDASAAYCIQLDASKPFEEEMLMRFNGILAPADDSKVSLRDVIARAEIEAHLEIIAGVLEIA